MSECGSKYGLYGVEFFRSFNSEVSQIGMTLNPEFDRYLYRLLHLVENAFARLQHFRSIATRFDKTGWNYKAMMRLACNFIWCKAK